MGSDSLGPSPVLAHPLPPGEYQLTLKGNGKTRKLAVTITSGKLTPHTVSME